MLEATYGKDAQHTEEFRKSAHQIAVLIGQAPADSVALDSLPDDAEATGDNVLLANLMAGIAEKKGDSDEQLRLSKLAFKLSDAHFGPLHQRTLTLLAKSARVEHARKARETVATYVELERRLRLWSRREYASSSDTSVLEEVARSTRNYLGDILSYANFAARDNDAALQLFSRVFLEWKSVGSVEREALRAAEGKLSADDRALAVRVRALQQQSLTLPRGSGGDVERELAIAEGQLASRVSALDLDRGDLTYGDVLHRLQPGEAIVDYMIAPVRLNSGVVDNVFAIVGMAGAEVELHDLGPLEKVAGPLLKGGSSPNREARRALYDTLFGHIEEGLEGVTRVTIVPDGLLNVVPFEGLLDANGKNLIEKRDVRIARNARAVSGGRDRAVEPAGVLLVGDVDYGAGSAFASLPNTRAEVEQIAATLAKADFKATSVEGKDAQETGLRSAAGGKRILHFATHGFFQPVSENETAPLWRAGVALSGANMTAASDSPAEDGVLYAAELTGWALDGVELVVLSACDTAQGDRSYVEGLSGLPSALAAAGAKRSLLARWPVDDRGAANFMVRFYENLVAKRSYAVALRQTKLDAIAGTIDGVGDDTWLAFALIENTASESAPEAQQPVGEAAMPTPVAAPSASDEGACGVGSRSAEAC